MNPALIALIVKDLRLFFRDRRALAMSLVAPVVLGAFMGYFFSGDREEKGRIRCMVVDQDRSALSGKIAQSLGEDKALEVVPGEEDQARAEVRKGRAAVALLVPKGFGEAATRGLFGAEKKTTLTLLVDPSRGTEAAMLRGLLAQHAMQAVSTEAFNGDKGLEALQERIDTADATTPPEVRKALKDLHGSLANLKQTRAKEGSGDGKQAVGGMSLPYELLEEPVTARTGVAYNGYVQSFSGMGVQFVLFMGLESGIVLLGMRRSALWKRLRTSPVSRRTFLTARILSAMVIAFVLMLGIFAAAMAFFGVRIHGSLPGFLLVVAAFSLFTGAFGLCIAALGRTPEATRGLSIMATLFMLMLGGAWVPSFLFPPWVQKASFLFPTRWVLEGLQAMTWRGLPFSASLLPAGVLLAFALGLGLLAFRRFPFED